MIDSHCHLEYMEDVDAVVAEAKQRGVTAMVASTADIKHVEKIMTIKKKYPDFVFVCLGFHPEVMIKYTQSDIERYMQFIRTNRDKISAIGEVGLDYNWVSSPDEQRRSRQVFIKFIELAKELDLPMVIHSRNGKDKTDGPADAISEVINILIDNAMTSVMLHCFSGSETNLRAAVEQGWMISFATLVCKSDKHKRLAKLVPMEQMLLETDSPWLDPDSPELINRPWKIERSAEVIAELRNTTKEHVLRQTEQNARQFFGI